jgi:hypothetical protein
MNIFDSDNLVHMTTTVADLKPSTLGSGDQPGVSVPLTMLIPTLLRGPGNLYLFEC